MTREGIAVVTAVTGRYDHPRRDTHFDPDVDYLYFSDDWSAKVAREPWQRVRLEMNGRDLHPRRLAKGPKLNPHRFDELDAYRYVVWVDGGIHIRSADFVREIVAMIGTSGIILSPHHDGRTDAYGEAEIRPPKYADEPLDEQVAAYHRAGYPGNDGLYECGVMARDMEHGNIRELGRYWEGEVERFSYQDQVSLPFVLWSLGLEPDVMPKSFRHMGWVAVNGHRSDR
jgi:hypothetical protein